MMAATVTSPKSLFGLCSRHKPLRVMVLGQSGVGKSALVVRFITKRFIGEYDPTLEKTYMFHTVMDNEMIYFEILDTAGQPYESNNATLETNIRWAEAFILMYSVTDKCSFDECNRLKFLINYNKRRKRLGSNNKDCFNDVPVVLVGNKSDQVGDRMVTTEDGTRRCREIGCLCFHEISIRESIEQVWTVFKDVYHLWKIHYKMPKLKRSSTEIQSPDSHPFLSFSNGKSIISVMSGRRWTDADVAEKKDGQAESGDLVPFRDRASTDGHLLSKPRKWKYPLISPSSSSPTEPCEKHNTDRRMSISMRGANASY